VSDRGDWADRPAWLDGAFTTLGEARISPLDRGFLFGDAVYEVIPVHAGRPFRLAQHLDRLARSLREVRIPDPLDREAWSAVVGGLVERAPWPAASVYLQVSRGVAPRDHAFPDAPPTVFGMAGPLESPPARRLEQGYSAITLEDIRWRRCDIKTTSLIANVLGRQAARDQGADEALFIRDGFAVEGAATNLFVVREGVVFTPPHGPDLLPGVTRDLVVELLRAADVPCRERPVPASWLAEAAEIWITSSTKDVVPVTRLDGRPVGAGRPGPLWERIHALFREWRERERP
jgi:D-alanine transaminase